MNGPQHYLEAERLMELARSMEAEGEFLTIAAEAQVHATLALTAAQVDLAMSKGIYRDSGWMDAVRPLVGDVAPIEDLDLTIRSYNVLKREGVHTIGDLTKRTIGDLMDMRNLGANSIDNITSELAKIGRTLAETPESYFS